MIDGNMIKFGSGTIGVGASFVYVTFQTLKNQAEVGEFVDDDDVDVVGNKIMIEMDSLNFHNLMSLLNNVESGNTLSFEFDGYVFDFSNYNRKSLEAIRKKARKANNAYLCLCAC